MLMRQWWIDELAMNDAYEGISINQPPSIFEDKTLDIKRFNEDFATGQLSNIVNAMNNENIINANILCPWSCSTNCRDSGKLPLDLMIQRILNKVDLKLYTDNARYRYVNSCWNQYFREDNKYPTILLKENWPIKPSIIIDEDGVHILTCKQYDGGHDKLTLYPPQSPYNHILNARQPDQLTQCVQIPRI